jgi:hypothetical protein
MSMAQISDRPMTWADQCEFGSCWTTVVSVEFHHVMADPDALEDTQRLAPFPSDATAVTNDCRSGFLVWLWDGSPVHARWCNDDRAFKRIGDDKLVERTSVRAWAPLPFPVAAV